MKGQLFYLHSGKDIGSGAFDLKERSELKIRLPRAVGVSSVIFKIFKENMELYGSFEGKASFSDHNTDVYSLSIKLPVGLYFFHIELSCPCGTVYGMKKSFSEIEFREEPYGESFQLTVYDFKFSSCQNALGGIIYHVFVDRFARGGVKLPKRVDAVMLNDWDNGIPEYPEYPGAPLKNNTFFGGDLYGVIEKLDYIKSLGTSIIYLSPIFEAYSNHKYDTADYLKVDDMFGSDKALKKLIAEAKKKGIGIVLDGVFNHTGSDSVYFNKNGRYKTLGAYQSKNSEYYPWYDFKDYPDKYTCWWDIEILPRINPDVKECGDFLAGPGGVVDKYAKMGILGIRLDVADELSDCFIKRIKGRLEEAPGDHILYGEVWEDASNKIAYEKRKRYYLGEELDGVMNYPLRKGIISYLRDKKTKDLEYALGDIIFNAPKRIRDMQMNLLGTHDTERIITVLAGEDVSGRKNSEIAHIKMSEEEKSRGIKLLKMAYTILATLPGIPAIFYGDEVGLEGYKDPFNRRPFPWNNTNEDLLSFYRKIGNIRREFEVYKEGDYTLLWLCADSLAFRRTDGVHDYITVVNNDCRDMTLSSNSKLSSLIRAINSKSIVLSSMSADVIKLKANSNFKIDKF